MYLSHKYKNVLSQQLKHTVFSNISHIFFTPENENKALVIRMHGLPGRSPNEERSLLANLLAENNIALFAFDFPGIRKSKGYYSYRNSYQTAKSILDYFAFEHEEIFPKIGIYGESFGGSIAVSLSKSNSAVSSLFLWSPVLNFNELLKEIQIQHIIKFMEDSGVIRLPHYDNFSQAFTTQIELNPPEHSHDIFNKIPVKIIMSDSDILFPPFVIKKQLEEKYHFVLERINDLDHNLNKPDAALKLSQLANNFFVKHLY